MTGTTAIAIRPPPPPREQTPSYSAETPPQASFDAFASLLQVTASSTPVGAETTRASEMFEPARPEGGQRVATPDSRGEGEQPAERFDRTSVQARRDAGGDIEDKTPTGANRRDTGDRAELAQTERKTGRGEATVRAGADDRLATDRTSTGMADRAAKRSAPTSNHQRSQPSVERSAGVAAVAQVAQSSAASKSGDAVARQVAEVLSTARTSGAAAGRAAAGSEQGQAAATDRTPRNGDGRSARSQTAQQKDGPPVARSPQRAAFDRLVQAIRLSGGAKSGSAKLSLSPPELGRMSVDIEMQRGELLRIDIRTQSVEARDLLHERVAELRAALEERGLRLVHFVVTADLGEQSASEPADADDSDEQPDTDRHGGSAEDRAITGEARGRPGRMVDSAPVAAIEAPTDVLLGDGVRLDIQV